MKTYIISFLLISLLSITSVFAEVSPVVTNTAINNVEAVTTQASTGVTLETTKVETQQAVELIQYDYYHSETCRFCQMLDKFLIDNNAYDTLNINKIDVAVRGDEMQIRAEALGVTRPGTPFVVYKENGKETYIPGGYPGAVEYFSNILGVESTILTEGDKKMNKLLTIIFGLLIIIGPLAYLGLKK
ncbi:MAG: hypothetical protein GY828_07625 [Candidatus Gracilibacteria bacterium]|nr:hypothetical protein [Candidatus Gracilibacteria bacterium]